MPDPSPVAGDRRPVKSRSWRTSQATANWLAVRGISPNGISVMGMIAGLAGGLALGSIHGSTVWDRILWLVGAVAIQLRLQANLLDGMVAMQTGRTSRIGELFNEVPDRVSDTALLVGAGYALGGEPLIGLWASLAAMLTAYIRTTGKTAGAPMDFCGPMAKQHRMAVLTIVCLANVAGYSHLTWGGGLSMELVSLGLWIILIGSMITAMRRLIRISVFLRSDSS